MNITLLVQFMALIDEMKQAPEVAQEFERLLDRYGFDFYGILTQPKLDEAPHDLVLAGRWPEAWPDVYISKKYVLIDPTIRYLGYAQKGFRWRDTAVAFRNDPHRRRMERMMLDARDHGLVDGYLFPVHGRGGLLGNLTIGGRTVDLSPIEMTLFDAIAKKLFWKLLEFRPPSPLNRTPAAADIMLTRREMEALHYLAEGLTSNEIGKILKISSHTVDWYMNGIQEKLNAKNRHHAVALSFRLGLIS